MLLSAALLVLGGLYSVVAPSRSTAAPVVPEEVARGQALYVQNCSSCHGLGGEGTSQAPDIRNVGAAAVHFQVSSGRMPMAGQAVQAPRRQNLYTDAEVQALADYVASLGTGPAIPAPAQYDPAGLSEEEIAKGGEIFRTNCSACHNFAGNGGALPNGVAAPPLTGDVTPQQILEALRTGPGQMPVFPESSLPDEDARAVIGYLTELHEQPSGGSTLGGIGPVAEGFAAWVIGIGGLSLFAVWIASKGARAR